MSASQPPRAENNVPLMLDVEAGLKHRRAVRDYRKLAVCSIVCGLSCVGIASLMYSVKTREINKRIARGEKVDPELQSLYSRKARRWGVASFVACVVLFVVIILALGLLSYVLTFIN